MKHEKAFSKISGCNFQKHDPCRIPLSPLAAPLGIHLFILNAFSEKMICFSSIFPDLKDSVIPTANIYELFAIFQLFGFKNTCLNTIKMTMAFTVFIKNSSDNILDGLSADFAGKFCLLDTPDLLLMLLAAAFQFCTDIHALDLRTILADQLACCIDESANASA